MQVRLGFEQKHPAKTARGAGWSRSSMVTKPRRSARFSYREYANVVIYVIIRFINLILSRVMDQMTVHSKSWTFSFASRQHW